MTEIDDEAAVKRREEFIAALGSELARLGLLPSPEEQARIDAALHELHETCSERAKLARGEGKTVEEAG